MVICIAVIAVFNNTVALFSCGLLVCYAGKECAKVTEVSVRSVPHGTHTLAAGDARVVTGVPRNGKQDDQNELQVRFQCTFSWRSNPHNAHLVLLHKRVCVVGTMSRPWLTLRATPATVTRPRPVVLITPTARTHACRHGVQLLFLCIGCCGSDTTTCNIEIIVGLRAEAIPSRCGS